MKEEKGRSMVEMLGVLAIIGILSITGIYGYTIAMRRYKANEIVQAASMLVVMSQAANSGQGDCMTLTSSGLSSTIGGESIEMKAETEVDGAVPNVDIRITNDDDNSLCDAVQSMISDDHYSVVCGLGAEVTCSND